MHLTGLLDMLSATSTFNDLIERLERGETAPSQAVVRSARPFVVAALAHQLQIPVLVVTGRVDRAYNIAEQLLAWLPQARVLRLQEPTAMFYERAPWTANIIRARLQTLAALAPPIPTKSGPSLPQESPPIIVTSAYVLMQKTLPARDFRVGSRQFHIRQRIDLEKMLSYLVSVGYEATSVVTAPGTFCRRGGILDVFPPAAEFPVRIEFFGDEIDSLRTFRPETQRSHEAIETFVTTPAREATPKALQTLAARLKDWFTTLPDPAKDVTSPLADFSTLQSGVTFPHAEYYLPFVYRNAASLLDYLPDEALIVVESWNTLQDTIGELETQAIELREDRLEANQLPPDAPLAYHTWDDLHESLETRTPLHLGQPEVVGNGDGVVGDMFTPGPRFGGQLRLFLDHLQNGEQAIVVTRQAQRIAELWSERSDEEIIPWAHIDNLDALPDIAFVEGELAGGWVLDIQGQRRRNLFTDAEIFGWKRPEPRRRVQKRPVNPEAYFADLEEGDYVVHVDYGIGCFQGIQKRRLQDTEREYLVVGYAGNDMLYVPIHQADRLSKYVGTQKGQPTLNRLGTQDWSRTRKRTQQAVQDAAEELLDLYAARNVIQGHAFSPDTPWQHELEASFPYVETDDQIQALREVKTDMESSRPMDRLMCGDAGYGKTEVALRAAFKAVMDGKQVALLVPTTVLAQQHYTTFAHRLVAFPVNVEMLSRFRTPAEQRSILFDTFEGRVDILIGTHRILQEDVHFKNLGLLIIDEEQRFGVTHKERLKKMRTEVDVLTMTATPIPRTLYMGLTGLRDICLIQTPPEERLPVLNHVGVFDEKLVRQAILRELDRGGQVFFVHNRVRTIYTIADRLRRLVPEATIAIGHGQMSEHQLEDVMTDFVNGEYDVLVSTTIIENGIDIPNANTIIIDRADRFGLSQLYQLRGRVGRSANQGYVYFFHPRNQPLTPEARARLDTINEYTDLGAGMSIAVRDLEIRGMGDLLGLRQSGYIDAVGFHLYTQMLTESVHSLKDHKSQPSTAPQEPAVRPPVTIDLPLPAYIPTDFIDDMALRVQLYRRLANIESVAELDAMEAELQDRFGKPPKAVRGLLYQIRVKLLAQMAGATGISTERSRLSIRLPYLGSIDRVALQSQLGQSISVSRTAIWIPMDEEDEVWPQMLIELLNQLRRETYRAGMY